jgi:hypothetical protein
MCFKLPKLQKKIWFKTMQKTGSNRMLKIHRKMPKRILKARQNILLMCQSLIPRRILSPLTSAAARGLPAPTMSHCRFTRVASVRRRHRGTHLLPRQHAASVSGPRHRIRPSSLL